MAQAKGIQSIETGFRVLRALEASTRPLTLSEVAKESGIATSNTRFYLVSLMRVGAVTQTAYGRYKLGPAALRMGLAALSQLEILELARAQLESLRDSTGDTVFLSVWSDRGPVVVNRVDGEKMAPLGVRVGSLVPLTHSATGKAFLSFLPAAATRSLLKKESRMPGRKGRPMLVAAPIEQVVAEVRRLGFAKNTGGVLAGIVALAAPVVNHEGAVQCVVTLMGTEDDMDISENGLPARRLLEMAQSISKAGGFSGTHASRPASPAEKPARLGRVA
jgi:DNA-binding IclR family transcriptional regulator